MMFTVLDLLTRKFFLLQPTVSPASSADMAPISSGSSTWTSSGIPFSFVSMATGIGPSSSGSQATVASVLTSTLLAGLGFGGGVISSFPSSVWPSRAPTQNPTTITTTRHAEPAAGPACSGTGKALGEDVECCTGDGEEEEKEEKEEEEEGDDDDERKRKRRRKKTKRSGGAGGRSQEESSSVPNEPTGKAGNTSRKAEEASRPDLVEAEPRGGGGRRRSWPPSTPSGERHDQICNLHGFMQLLSDVLQRTLPERSLIAYSCGSAQTWSGSLSGGRFRWNQQVPRSVFVLSGSASVTELGPPPNSSVPH